MTLLLRRDRPRIVRSNLQLSYQEAAVESERVVAWVVGRLNRTRPRKLPRVSDDCVIAVNAALAQLYAARRPANFPERAHHDVVDSLRKLLDKLVAYAELDEGTRVKADVTRETGAFSHAFESLRASGILDTPE